MQSLSARNVLLEPLTIAHADEMFDVLSDQRLYEFLDYGPPPSVEHLRHVYSKWQCRTSPDRSETWLNWVARVPSGVPVGFVQATVVPHGTAHVAYVFSVAVWGRGVARAAVAAMMCHLRSHYGCSTFLATIEAANHRSIALLTALGFHQVENAKSQSRSLSCTERLYERSVPHHGAPCP